MTGHKCPECDREFDSEKKLSQHIQDRHESIKQKEVEALAIKKSEATIKAEAHKTAKKSDFVKKAKVAGIAIIVIVVIIAGIYFVQSQAKAQLETNIAEGIPLEKIHWHPKLTIIIAGEEQKIPDDLGLSQGHEPIHTHGEGDGTLHMENDFPTSENVRLGYFFKVWGKTFNKECIFDNCNTEDKKVTMTVNGIENKEFQNYIMHDEDSIVITYG